MERPTRTAHAQLEAMRRRWPDIIGEKRADGLVVWRGPLQPKAKPYVIAIMWRAERSLPYVMVLDPVIRPRAGGAFDEIPHLIFHAEDPELSGLCLFNPDGKEWSPADLIADTTVPWAAEWLTYYELWHLTGEWLAPGVGRESVGRLRASEARAIKEAVADVH